MELTGKVAIVTGSATGIGRAIAAAYAKAGASVVVDYVGGASTADDTLARITAAGGASLGIEADVSQPADVARLVAGTVEKFGRLDVLVNDAGIEKKLAFLDYPLEEWQKIIAVNLTGPFLCSQAAAKQMIKQGQGGRIVNISSIHEDLPLVLNAPYSASKGGLRMLMRTIAVELAPYKIGVNNIGPGAIRTPIDAAEEGDAAAEAQLMAEISMRRWGTPDEVAQLAVYLASDAAAYVTGSTFFIDGGMLRNGRSRAANGRLEQIPLRPCRACKRFGRSYTSGPTSRVQTVILAHGKAKRVSNFQSQGIAQKNEGRPYASVRCI
jgi:glucose 1-dehydrogenase